MENRREAKIEKLKKQKIREEHGEEAAPKGVTKTIESMRVKDETIITDADDEEIKGEQEIDEFAQYFNNETTPRILLTTNRRPNGVSHSQCFAISPQLVSCPFFCLASQLILSFASLENIPLLERNQGGVPRR